MKRKTITAAELVAQLEADPAWRRQRELRDAEFDRRTAPLADDEAELVAQCRQIGYDIDSVWDFVNNAPHPILERRFLGPYERAYPALVRHLDVAHHPKVREGVIRALTVKDGGRMVWEALLRQFEVNADDQMRWVLANALRTAMPYRERRKRPEIAEAYRSGGKRPAGSLGLQPTAAYEIV